MKIGVYVGSFNPVHKGHIKIARYIVDNKIVDKLFIIPTLSYWDKNNLVSLDDRINMLKFYENDKIIIDSEFSALEYTYQIMNALKEKYNNNELCLIIGADNIISFDKWKNYTELLKYVLIIVNRDDVDTKYYLDKLGKKDKYVITKDLELINISSTMVRENIENIPKLREYLDEDVINYINEKKLYRK